VTTLTVARKGGEVAMAADSLVTFGDTRLSHGYEDNEKIFQVGDNLFGLSGTTAHFPVLRAALRGMKPEDLRLSSREQVFETFLGLHPRLKEHFFLNAKEEDADPYESSQFTVLIANPTGLYGVYSYREVFVFERFWSIGSGRAFALGAMWQAWDQTETAAGLAEIGVRAGCEFDKNSAGPARVHTLKLNT
jgi:ATP-dependent protease HslVU (ClpYQ) peptidase subunit